MSKIILNEDRRNQLIAKSKGVPKGKQRFKRRVKSKVANTVKQYNDIDMNKLFKDNIFTVNINVKGETDDYIVRISFGDFLDILQDEVKDNNEVLNLRAITRALVKGFDRTNVFINCSCPDFRYRFNYWATRNSINSGLPEKRPSNITNPKDNLGSSCKHTLLVLSNNSWILKCASVINNYIKYMEKHYKKAYSDIIYPAIYGKPYEDVVELSLFDDDELVTDKDTLDKANVQGREDTLFKKGNTQGQRFAKKDDVEDEDSISLFDEEE